MACVETISKHHNLNKFNIIGQDKTNGGGIAINTRKMKIVNQYIDNDDVQYIVTQFFKIKITIICYNPINVIGGKFLKNM